MMVNYMDVEPNEILPTMRDLFRMTANGTTVAFISATSEREAMGRYYRAGGTCNPDAEQITYGWPGDTCEIYK